MGQFYNFKRVRLVHVSVGVAGIDRIADSRVFFTDDQGAKGEISLVECARIYRLLREANGFRGMTMIGVAWQMFPTLRASRYLLRLSSVSGRLLTIRRGSSFWIEAAPNSSSATTITYRAHCSIR